MRSVNFQKLENLRKLEVEQRNNEYHEHIANSYYYRLSSLYTRGKTNKNQFLSLLDEASIKMKELQKKVDTYNFNKKAFSIVSTDYIFKGNFDKVIENAETAIKYFEKKNISTYPVYQFIVDKIISNILLREHDKANKLIEEAEQLVTSNFFNYLRLQFYKYFNFSIKGDYNRMYETTECVINLKRINKIEYHHQLWKIREAYVRFLAEAGKVDF
jgi:tetratricopeptide (TPR) repeat protein